MSFRRVLGLPPSHTPGADAETATIRRIASELGALPEERRAFLAGFAYILSRAAHADLDITEAETRLMERTVVDLAGLPEPQAVLVVEIAKAQALTHGGTDDYIVTRRFRELASEEERLALLRCCFAVGAADDSITAYESAELTQISDELGLERSQLAVVRNEYRDRLAALQQMRRPEA